MAFPTATSTGIAYEHFEQFPRDWASITDTYEYEDGGMDFNLRASGPAYKWRVEFRGGLSWSDIAQFDTFWEANGIHTSFSFTDKFSVTWTGVRILEYSRSHDRHRWWDQRVAFTLVKYP